MTKFTFIWAFSCMRSNMLDVIVLPVREIVAFSTCIHFPWKMVSQVFPPVIFAYCGVGANNALVHTLVIPSSRVVFQVGGIVIVSIGIVAASITANGTLGEIALFHSGSSTRFPRFRLLLCTFFHKELLGTVNSDVMHELFF